MTTDSEIKQKGMEALIEKLGAVDAERFITLLLREPFDYTEWQKDLWPDASVRELSARAMNYVKKQKK